MPNVYSETTKIRKAVPLLPIWYLENPLETAMRAGNLKLLSNDNLSYTTPISGIVKSTEYSED